MRSRLLSTLLCLGCLGLLSGLTGCAEICERGENLSKSFPKRHAECFAPDTLPSPVFDAKACKSSMNACSPTDEAALHAYFDCVERLPVCAKDDRVAFSEQVLACATGMGRLSEGCFRP
jgi:hypothetical protein